MYYLLNKEGEPYRARDFEEWIAHAGLISYFVKKSWLYDCSIFTCFISMTFEIPPLWWGTMVVNGPLKETFFLCGGSREQALAQHDHVCAIVAAKFKENGNSFDTQTGSSQV